MLPQGRLSWPNVRAVLLATVGYAIVAVWVTRPLGLHLSSHLPGGSIDLLVHYWNGWWVGEALAAGQTPFFSNLLFHPDGLSLVFHNFAWMTILPWLLLRPWLGGFAAYNLVLLLTLAFCGVAVYFLITQLTRNRWAAFLSGLVYMLWPYRLSQLGHPNLISTQWVPLLFLGLILLIRHGRWRVAALVGLLLALVGYTRWQQLIPVAIMVLVFLAATLPAAWGRVRRWAGPLLLAGALALLLLAPPALLLASELQVTDVNLLRAEEESTKQTDVLAYVTPASSHPIFGEITESLHARYVADRASGRDFVPYVGWTTLLLAAIGIWRARGDSLPWVLMALALIVLALGPILRFNGELVQSVPMPYELLAELFPPIRLLRFPDRFNMFLALPLSVLAGYGIVALQEWSIERFGRAGLVAMGILLLAAILFDFQTEPISVEAYGLPEFYRMLAAQEGDSALLNLPMDEQQAKWYMFSQTGHGRPILQGKSSRIPDGAYAYLDGHPWLRVLRQSDEMPPQLTDVSRQLNSLAADGIGYVVLHKELAGSDRLEHWQRYLLIQPRYEDEAIAVYTTTPEAGRDFHFIEELAPGIGLIDASSPVDCLPAGQTLAVDVGWGSTAATEEEYRARLELVAFDGEVIHREETPLSPGWPTNDWPADTVAWGYYTLTIPAGVPDGQYELRLGLVAADDDNGSGETAAIGVIQSGPGSCPPPVEAPTIPLDARFGEVLRLLGYEFEESAAELKLILHWRADRRMNKDYKIFVHVFDPASGVPVAQDDAMPRRWGYPTTFWAAGEIVDDTIPIYLSGVPAGTYGIAVGVYDPLTGERLAVIDGAGNAVPDGRLILPDLTVEID